jgi:hypothetical protein
MLIEKITAQRIKKDGTPSKHTKVTYVFVCDSCNKRYEKKPGNVSQSKSGLTFCSQGCRHKSHKKGNDLHVFSVVTCIERYGVPNQMQSDEIKSKRVQAFQDKYGENVRSPLDVPGAKEKRRRTHIERYGEPETFQNPEFVEKRSHTWLKKYGVPYHPFPHYAAERSRNAMCEKPIKWQSKAEIEFGELLIDRYGTENIVAQKWVNKWPIDFYVKCIDTYIQFDGTYWHALDCDIDELRESTGVRDQARLKKWETDRVQVLWFADKGLRLIRISDQDFKSNPEKCLNRCI